MKHLMFFSIIMIFMIASCTKDQLFNHPDKLPGNSSPNNLISPQIKIAVVSDIHYMDPSIAPDDPATNPSYQADVSVDRKIFELSDPILKRVLSDLKAEKPDILLITGDLAKDGEMAGHETVKGFLQELENDGIKVFVVPGNNDINNADAKSYKDEPATTVPTITADQFFNELYGDFGYDEALYRDPASLSYICQPYSNLWILGIDGIKRSATSAKGQISDATLAWIQEKMTKAREKNITVLAMMHFGIIEHYSGQNNLEPLIKNSPAVADALMSAGIRLIFTGHYHANDIVDYSNNGKTLTDIQTGSLVTPPFSYRMMILDDNFINIDSRKVTDVRSEITGGLSFMKYCDITITNRLNSFFEFYLPLLFGYTEEQAEFAAPYLTNGFKAYCAGDEKISPAERTNNKFLDQDPYTPLYGILNTFWTDLPPKDNKIHIKLK